MSAPLQRPSVVVASSSARVREPLSVWIRSRPFLQFAGDCDDPLSIAERPAEEQPDILLMEASESRVDTLMVLRRLTRSPKISVVVLDPLADVGSSRSLELFNAGALDVLELASQADIRSPALLARLERSLKAVPPGKREAVAPPRPPARVVAPLPSTPRAAQPPRPAPTPVRSQSTRPHHPRQLLLIGASTGGTEAIREVLRCFPADMPPIAIVQHIPASFSKPFADRLNSLCQVEVREAVDRDVLSPGLALVAPGGFHMEVHWQKDHYEVRLTQAPQEHHQRPAVDVTFRTGAAAAGSHALGVLLTGMGRDGALGMKALREAGAHNIAQDEKTSVVYGMPAAARELGVVDQVLGLQDVAAAVMRRLDQARGGDSSPAPAVGETRSA